MKIRLEITCDNAAFEDNPNELGDILRHIGRLADNHGSLADVPIYDTNGNRVGLIEIDPPVCCLCKK